MLISELKRSGDVYKLIVNGIQIDSALHAICRQSLNMPLSKTVSEKDVGRLEECVPCSVSDVHQFSRMAYAVRNSYFNIPNAMMYPKFKYVLREMTRATQIPELMYLDPMCEVNDRDRIEGLKQLSPEYTAWAANLCVYRVINTADSILSLPLAVDSKVSVSTNILSLGMESNIHLMFKECEVLAVSSEHSKNYLLRLLASESDDVPPRTMFLLSDDSIPLLIIPGFTMMKSVVAEAQKMSG
nr:hypothetical protein [Plasmopara viticola lesion associated mononegaambi virus 8]